MSVTIYYSYLLPCATNALTLYMWSSSMAGFSKWVTGCYLTSTRSSSLLLKMQELTFSMLPRLGPISVPDCSFCTCGIIVRFHVKVSYAL